ncbi:MAG TPA: hypothetical protein VL133_05855 [Devosia sp.]|nr:hypothetical protein [Devosia sp.]
MRLVLAAVAVAAMMVGPAFAKDADCYTTDDGDYPCTFESLDSAGSFEISAPGKPVFQVWVERPGEASVGAVFEAGGRSVALPGTYFRSEDDEACWVSDATEAELCAW